MPLKAVDAVIKFYCEDGIRRVSSNSKDTIQINKKPVAVRLMEMTILDAFRIFEERLPGTIKRSIFYSLRPRPVKIATPHETCACVLFTKIWIYYSKGLLLRLNEQNFIFNSQ